MRSGQDASVAMEGRGSRADAGEVRKFDALAARWWNARGPMRPLHAMNPARVGWIMKRVRARYGNAPVRVLDVGCGAGLLSESLAKAGFAVTGIDAAGDVIAVARDHAGGQGLEIDYRVGEAEALREDGARFDVVTALEVIEHVPDQAGFVATLAGLVAPGGLLFMSTINRTPQSAVIAKFGAEYVLRMLPVGTHDWRRFVTPGELGAMCRAAGLRLADVAGLVPALPGGGFRASRNTGVNYIAMAVAGER